MSSSLILLAVVVIIGIAGTLALQCVWTRQLYHQHGDRYAYWFIFRKLGRSPFGRLVLQPRESLDPAFKKDLEHMQANLFLAWIAFGAVLFVIVGWRFLSILGD